MSARLLDRLGAPLPYDGEFVRVVIGSTIHGLSIAGNEQQVEDGRVAVGCQPHELAEAVDREIDVAGPGRMSFWLGAPGEDTLNTAIDTSTLPEHPDRGRLDEWLVGAYLRHWESPRPVQVLQP